VDAPLLASALGVRLEVPPRWRLDAPRAAPRPRLADGDQLDAWLWWQVHARESQPGGTIASLLDPALDGPLIAPEAHVTVEVWTESELCALHALGRIVQRRRMAQGDAGVAGQAPFDWRLWHRRLNAARLWHLEHTQPDNATNRPWAVAVFAEAPERESQLYAETLLHNAIVAGGQNQRAGGLEPLSSVILLDAAAHLMQRGWQGDGDEG